MVSGRPLLPHRRLVPREARVHPSVDLPADLVQEGIHDRIPVGGAEFAVHLRSGPELLRSKR